MSINDGILVCEICFVITIHEKTACKIIGSLKCPVQIVVVILALHKRIGNIQCPDTQPADDIFIYRLQLIKINRIAHDRNRNLFSVFFDGFHRFSGNRLYRRCILQRIIIIECIVISGTLPVRCITALQIVVLIGAFFVILIKSIQCPSRIQENTKCNNHQKKTQNITECPFSLFLSVCVHFPVWDFAVPVRSVIFPIAARILSAAVHTAAVSSASVIHFFITPVRF